MISQGSIRETRLTAGAWETYLQRRVMHLLLQHNQHLFREQFHVFFEKSKLPNIPLLQFYDHYLKLKLYHKELLEDIMPRIRRQWSLQTSNQSLQEVAPTRGEIDWHKTIQRAVEETPDQLPMSFDTNLRQQSMIIPENIAVVAILRYYQKIVQTLSREDQAKELLSEAERQELVGLEEQIERELAVPQTRIPVSVSTRNDIDELVEQVRSSLRPGSSPYWDLLNWWEQISTLAIGLANERLQPALAQKRRKEQEESQLYELWIALELLTLLQERAEITADEVKVELDTITWLWQHNGQRYRFVYQREASQEVENWEHLLINQAHYLIEREQPFEIIHKGKTIWKEPPCILEAAYINVPGTMQHILGSMQATGAIRSILITPLTEDATEDKQWSQETSPRKTTYTDSATRERRIWHYQITPDMDHETLWKRLHFIIEQALQSFPEKREPACYGMMINTESINDSGNILRAYDVICPKPHVSPGVFDLVNREQHCLIDATYCHVIGKINNPPRVIPKTSEGLEKEIEKLREYANEIIKQATTEEEQEQQKSRILERLGQMVEEFTRRQSGGKTKLQEKFLKNIFLSEYWDQHPRKLAKETRDILISGEYVWDEYDDTNLQDWAAPAIQYCRALEREIKRRLYEPAATKFQKIKSKQWTLGKLKDVYYTAGNPNRDILLDVVKQSNVPLDEFDRFMQRTLDQEVYTMRNELAHGQRINQFTAEKIKSAIIGTPKAEGLLYWVVANLDPSKPVFA